MLSYLLTLASFGGALWLSGAYQKYPELSFPLYLIWFAAITPTIFPSIYPTDDDIFQKRLRHLDKQRLKLVKKGNVTAEEKELEDQISKLFEERDRRQPVTLGYLNRQLEALKSDIIGQIQALASKTPDEDDDGPWGVPGTKRT